MSDPMFLMYTPEYWAKRSNHVKELQRFISERLERTPDRGLTRIDLLTEYTAWVAQQPYSPPSTGHQYLIELWIEATNGEWTGWKRRA